MPDQRVPTWKHPDGTTRLFPPADAARDAAVKANEDRLLASAVDRYQQASNPVAYAQRARKADVLDAVRSHPAQIEAMLTAHRYAEAENARRASLGGGEKVPGTLDAWLVADIEAALLEIGTDQGSMIGSMDRPLEAVQAEADGIIDAWQRDATRAAAEAAVGRFEAVETEVIDGRTAVVGRLNLSGGDA